jgi:hypothetical protein
VLNLPYRKGVRIGLLRVWVPIVVCDLHKLPRRGWSGLENARFRRRASAGRDVLWARAWISHDRLAPPS